LNPNLKNQSQFTPIHHTENNFGNNNFFLQWTTNDAALRKSSEGPYISTFLCNELSLNAVGEQESCHTVNGDTSHPCLCISSDSSICIAIRGGTIASNSSNDDADIELTA
jgi:hypothetical protein